MEGLKKALFNAKEICQLIFMAYRKQILIVFLVILIGAAIIYNYISQKDIACMSKEEFSKTIKNYRFVIGGEAVRNKITCNRCFSNRHR